MYMLYLDESGNENNPQDRYFVLAGLALFEGQTYFLNERMRVGPCVRSVDDQEWVAPAHRGRL